MGIRESLLNTITSAGNSDFVRIVTSAGASSKATVANLFKSFESGLGAKSSLTNSDYIRVVGSDNNLYKQSVSSVKSALGITALEDRTKAYLYEQSSGDFLTWVQNTFTNNGEYYVIYATTNTTGWPSSGTGTCLVQRRNADYYLTAYINTTGIADGQSVYFNRFIAGRWLGWTQALTRAEVEALETTVTGTTNQFGAINLNLPWRNYEIIAIASTNGNQWCIPTIVGASTYARVLTDGASWAPVANASVSLIVRYRHYSQ